MSFRSADIFQRISFLRSCAYPGILETKVNLIFSGLIDMVLFEGKKRRTRKITTYIVKHGGGSVLVWGWMSAVGVGSLKSIHGLVNHKVYIDI
ncbi:hypothetical protein HZH68_015456 [Vespula germanica]|uniref:Uncharacterized protein n=1 Tax=Vespula germanica TaxID=30212 RepID=A0A834J6V0_VESGE|nr:hypothetical protein HZH68_015456 [Vespula germanica]